MEVWPEAVTLGVAVIAVSIIGWWLIQPPK